MAAMGRKFLAVLLSVTLLLSLVGTAAAQNPPGGSPSAPFWDTYGTKYQTAVDSLYALKVVSGKSDVSFDPKAQVTRAQMAAFVMRALGREVTVPSRMPFSDVSANDWSAAYVSAASELGIVKGGTDGLFHPEDPVTYVQVAAMLLRALHLEYRAGTYPVGYVLLANELGLIEGTDWVMDKPATRGDVALMVYRAVFEIPVGETGRTLSQTIFKRPGAIILQPEGQTISAGTTRMTAKVVDWAGKELVLPVTWKTAGAGSSIDTTGNLSVSSQGTVTVTATAGDVSASRTFTVVSELIVKSDKTAVAAGAQVQLSAYGKLASGAEVAVVPAWQVTNGNGTVTVDGVLTVRGPGAVTVRATSGGLSAEKTIYVVKNIAISPANVTVAANTDVQFTATVTDGAGQSVPTPVTWSVAGGGSIDQTGKLRTGTTAATVTASVAGAEATARVTLLGRLEVSPNNAVVPLGTARQFTATAYSSDNRAIDTEVTWSVEPSTLGFFGRDGRFFAQAAGSGHAVATGAGMITRVPIAVAGEAVGLSISASPTSLPANGTSTSTITVRAVDASGFTASGVTSVMVSLNSANAGKLDQTMVTLVDGIGTATLTAGTVSGSYSIMAAAPGTSLPGATLAFATVVPTISHIALEVYPNPLAADGISQTSVIARLIDATGAPMVNNTNQVISVYLNQSNTAAGRLSGAVIQIGINQKEGKTNFLAGTQPGTTVITGNSTYQVRSATVNSVVVGAAYKLRIRPGLPSAKADGTSEIPVSVEVVDINGNVRTGDNHLIIAMSARNETDTLTVPSQQTTWGVATFRLKSTKAGTFTIQVHGVNTALQGDSSEVSFTAGSPYKVLLSVDPSNSLAADGVSRAYLKAKVVDVNNNLVKSATNQVVFVRETVSRNILVMPAVTSVNAVDGIAVLELQTTAGTGTDYFHAESNGLITSPQVSVSTRITGVPSKLQVQNLSEATIAAGTSTTIRVWVLDQLNQLVTGDNGRMVTLQATNGATVSSPAVPTVNGVATFTVSNTSTGGVGLTATAPGVAADSIGKVLTVTAAAPDHIALKATPEALSADGRSYTNVRADVVDRYGNPASGYYAVSLSLSTNAHLTARTNNLTTAGGQVQLTATTQPGTTVVSGTASGFVVTPLTISTYISGTPTRVVLDSISPIQAGNGLVNQAVVKARVLDENGNLVTSLSTGTDITALALQISGSGGQNTTNVTMTNSSGLSSYGIYPNGVTVGSSAVFNGMASFTVTNTRAETITLTPVVYYHGVRLAAEATAMQTTAGPASRLTVGSSATTVPASSATLVTVTASLSDSYGNPVAVADDTITFTANTTIYLTLPSQTVISAPSSSASITLTSVVRSSGGTTVVSASSRRTGFVGNVVITTDLPPGQPNVMARDSSGGDNYITSGESGARIIVTAPARNTEQKVTVYINGVVVPLYDTIDGTTLVDTITPGGISLTGYVKRSDLGGVGVKDVRAVISTPLGMSPLSDSSSLTVTP